MIKKTKTQSFGVSGRYSHDASSFYNSNLYNGFDLPNKIEYLHEEIPDNSINLMITSPPPI